MKKILLVDDDPLTIEFMRLLVEAEGYETCCASSYHEAEAAFQEHKPDIVITDVELNDGSGLTLGALVKAQSSARVIGVSGYDLLSLQEKGATDISTVFDALLTKPVELDLLKRALEQSPLN